MTTTQFSAVARLCPFTIHYIATLYLRYSDWRTELNIPLSLVPRLITYEWGMCFHIPIRLQGVTLNDRSKLQSRGFLSFVDRASLYNLVNKANLVHNLFLRIYQSLNISDAICAHHQEKQLCLCDIWYLLFCMDEPAYQTVIHTE